MSDTASVRRCGIMCSGRRENKSPVKISELNDSLTLSKNGGSGIVAKVLS
jgi:hypothetical protein